MKRPTTYCDTCESTVYADDIHTCHDAKALRAQQERERALTVAERRVVEAAEAWEFSFRDPADPGGWEVDGKHDDLIAAVRALRTVKGEAEHPCR